MAKGSVAVAVTAACALAFVAEAAIGNFLAFNPRAMTSEAKATLRCFARADAPPCTWDGWTTVAALAAQCPSHPCARADVPKPRYAYRRDGGLVVAVGVDVYDTLVGDAWLVAAGTGGEPIHCVDPIDGRGPLRRALGRPHVARRDADARCAVVDDVTAPKRTAP